MAIVTMPGFLHPFFAAAITGNTPVAVSNVALNASGEKYGVIIRVPKSGNIRKVGFRYGTLATPTDTEHRVETVSAQLPSGSLQGTNTSGTIASGSLSANAMNMVTLTADAVVTANDLIALVCAPSGSPNINLGRFNFNANQMPYWAQFDAGSWTIQSSGPTMAAIEYSDGTYAFVPAMVPLHAANTHTFNSTSTPDEIGARFRLPVKSRVSGGWLGVDLDNDMAVVLYDSDGVTPLATSSTLTNAGRQTTSGASAYHFMFPSAVTLEANTYYYFSVKPGASNISIYSWDVLSAAAMDQLPGGQDWHYVSAKDPSGTGSWTPILTRYPIMGLLIDGIDDGYAVVPQSQFGYTGIARH